MNSIQRAIQKAAAVALMVGTTFAYSCNNSQNTTKDGETKQNRSTKNKVYTDDFKYTADLIGDWDGEASNPELMRLDSIIEGAKPYNRRYIYIEFIKPIEGRQHTRGPITLGDRVLPLDPARLEYTEKSGGAWVENMFYGNAGVYEINLEGKIVGKYTLTKRGMEPSSEYGQQ